MRPMIWLGIVAALASILPLAPAQAQEIKAQTVSACGTPNNAPVTGLSYPVTQDGTGKLCTSASASLSGSTSNASSGVATSSTNVPTVSYNYGFNGATWDQIQVDGSKNLKVNCASGCAGGTFNNNADAVATSATNGQTAAWLYGFNGTTFDRVRVDTNKFLSTNLGDVGGSAIALGQTTMSASLPVAIASNQSAVPISAASLPLPTGAATSANQPTNAAQASTTSGQTGLLLQGAVTTSAPSYTTAQTDPLSLDTAGNLRVNVVAGGAGNACASATGSAVPSSGCLLAGGAAGGAGNLTGSTVKAASTAAVATDTSLVIDGNPGGALVSAINAGVATPGSAAVAKSIQIAGSDGTNAQTLSTDSTGKARVISAVPAAGAGTNTVLCNVQIKATATACGSSATHNITGWTLDNTGNAAASYVQVFNLATGSVTLGSTAPQASLPIPSNGVSNLAFPVAIGNSTAVTVACTTTPTGSTAPSANCGITIFGN